MGKFGRFEGGQHFKFLKKGQKDTTKDYATPGQLKALKVLGHTYERNTISRKYAEQLLKELRLQKTN